jgi:hypothetical protein
VHRETGRLRRAYLVRCWWENSAEAEARAWRFSVEEVSPQPALRRRRIGFGRLEDLVAFLCAELADATQAIKRSEDEHTQDAR